jgi:hypothetical protein
MWPEASMLNVFPDGPTRTGMNDHLLCICIPMGQEYLLMTHTEIDVAETRLILGQTLIAQYFTQSPFSVPKHRI